MTEQASAPPGTAVGSAAEVTKAMQPTRDPAVTLPDLLEVLLNKGVYLNLDLIIAVADVPLIGINLRATIAGLETMLEYGMMRNWDERTRAWVRAAVSRHLPLATDEDVVARMAGGYLAQTEHGSWRPGTIYLTTHRLVAYRRDPQEILWQTPLGDIDQVEVRSERSIGGEERARLHVSTAGGGAHILSTSEPERLHDLLRRHSSASSDPTPHPGEARPLAEGRMWFREDSAGKPLWRGGTGTLDAENGLTWKGALDSRPAVRLRPSEIKSVTLRSGDTPLLDTILLVRTDSGNVHLAVDDNERWAGLILQLLRRNQPEQVAAGADR